MLTSTYRVSRTRSVLSPRNHRAKLAVRCLSSSSRLRHMRPDMYRHIRSARQRLFRYAYFEKSRTDPTFEDSRAAIKRAMLDSMNKKGDAGSVYSDVDKIRSWSDYLSGVSPKQSSTGTPRVVHGPKDVTADEVISATAAGPAHVHMSTIDPITNRRIQIISSSEPSSTRSQDANRYGPVSWHEPDGLPEESAEEKSKHYEDLGSYEHKEYDDPNATRKLTPEEETKNYTDLNEYEPVRWNEPDGLLEKTPEELSKEYEDLHKYNPETHDDPNKPIPLTPEEKSKQYDDLDKYGPQRWNEPDGLPERTPEEQSKDYDDLHKYGAVRWNEPDGLPERTPEEKSKDYSDLGEYKAAVMWNEPDGLPDLTPEEKSKQYEDLDTYKDKFTAKDEVLQAHEEAQMDSTPRGRVLPAKVEAQVEDFQSKYEDLNKYGPVLWNEPDGLRPLTAEEKSKEYDDLDQYGAVRWNEPDGLRKLTPEEESKKYSDLPAYNAFDNDGPSEPRVHPEELTKVYADLPEYGNFDNGDAKEPWIHPEEASKAYNDLHLYKSHTRDGPEANWVHPEELSKNYSDLDMYRPQRFESPDTPYPMHPEEATKNYQDLGHYGAIKYNEPDGLPQKPRDLAAEGLKSHDAKLERSLGQAYSRHYNGSQELTAQDIRAGVMSRAKLDAGRTALEDAKTQHDVSWDATSDKAREGLRLSAKTPPKSKVSHASAEASMQAAKEEESELSPLDESFPSENEHAGKERNLSSSPASGKHASYKILVYDSIEEEVTIAETSSSVVDESRPLSPSEAIPRLQHAAKFTPYFGSLEAQGYEIVSGTADMLIFRKMQGRRSAPTLENVTVNPVDMTGKVPVTGNFASPTGFVNYETVASEQDIKPVPPPFKSNIAVTVRKEESVFSGQANNRSKPKSRFGRKMAYGTAWIVGGAYSVGVLAEYFSTGGLDGLGPRGL